MDRKLLIQAFNEYTENYDTKPLRSDTIGNEGIRDKEEKDHGTAGGNPCQTLGKTV